jgi:hypothetical protein
VNQPPAARLQRWFSSGGLANNTPLCLSERFTVSGPGPHSARSRPVNIGLSLPHTARPGLGQLPSLSLRPSRFLGQGHFDNSSHMHHASAGPPPSRSTPLKAPPDPGCSYRQRRLVPVLCLGPVSDLFCRNLCPSLKPPNVQYFPGSQRASAEHRKSYQEE